MSDNNIIKMFDDLVNNNYLTKQSIEHNDINIYSFFFNDERICIFLKIKTENINPPIIVFCEKPSKKLTNF